MEDVSATRDGVYPSPPTQATRAKRSSLTTAVWRDSMRAFLMPIQDRQISVSRLRTSRVFFAVASCGLVLTAVIFFGIGRWLVVEDPLEKATAIVVLSGAMPLRATEAGKLYREGYAPEIWLTHSSEPAGTLQEIGIAFAGEDYYNKLVLIHEGVPPEAIRLLEPPIVNTADEIRVAAGALSRSRGGVIIIVTTKAHTRRTRLLWRRLTSGPGRAIVRAASGDSFDPKHWWRTTGDALDVVRETLGLLNAWAGLPLHPAR